MPEERSVGQIARTRKEVAQHLAQYWAPVPRGDAYPGLPPGMENSKAHARDIALIKVRHRDEDGTKYGAMAMIEDDACPATQEGVESFARGATQYLRELKEFPDGYVLEWWVNSVYGDWMSMDLESI
jgi:hypothetical protein